MVVNGENAAGGSGITPPLVDELLAAGADVLTLGDHTWDQKEIIPYLNKETPVIRPANFHSSCPGQGWITLRLKNATVTIVSIIGRVFMQPHDSPFHTMDKILQKKSELGNIILVDVHAEATSEKVALGRYIDGRVTAVWGTHTHVQTADEAILPKGTAYISDLGMTGPKDSILGRDVDPVLNRFLTGMPSRFTVAKNSVSQINGILLDVDEHTGKARSIKRMQEVMGEP